MTSKVTSRMARWGWLLFLPRFGCSCRHLPVQNNRFIFYAFLFLLFSVCQVAKAIELDSDTKIASAGYFQLHWNGGENKKESLLLQESTTADFISYDIIYKGKDRARVMSGKNNGDYYYRISTSENKNSKISNVIKVTVAHHSLLHAILFFIAGAIVFVATLFLIIRGSQHKAE